MMLSKPCGEPNGLNEGVFSHSRSRLVPKPLRENHDLLPFAPVNTQFVGVQSSKIV